jgi:hypothetical protein
MKPKLFIGSSTEALNIAYAIQENLQHDVLSKVWTQSLPYGNSKRLKTSEISNWTGKALAAPRTEFDKLLRRKNLIIK